jgi:hypothetical protein
LRIETVCRAAAPELGSCSRPAIYALTYNGWWPVDGGDDMIRGMAKTNLMRATVVVAAFLSPSALFAQGCAMCYQTAAGSGAQFIQALRHGILIMFFPPILIMGAIFYAAYRKRNLFNSVEGAAAGETAFDEDFVPEWTFADEAELRKLTENES